MSRQTNPKHIFLRIETRYGRKSLRILPGQKAGRTVFSEEDEVKDIFGVMKKHPEGTVFATSRIRTMKKGYGTFLVAEDIFLLSDTPDAGETDDLFRLQLMQEMQARGLSVSIPSPPVQAAG